MKRIYLVTLYVIMIIISFAAFTTKSNNLNKMDKTKIYFGEWRIKKVVAFCRVSAIDDSEIKKLINQKVIYSGKQVNNGNKVLKNPYYKKTRTSDSDFSDYGYVELKDLGINKKYINKFELFSENNDDYAYYWYEFGGAFYIKDKNTLIVYYKGAYFELKRDKK